MTSLMIVPGCDGSRETSDPADATWIVSVSIPPQAFLVERIAGSEVRVQTLVHGGESPATYQPSDRQVSEVLRSNLYFRIGVPFERGPWFEAIRGSRTSMKVVDLRRGIPVRLFDGCGHPGHALQESGESSDHDHETDKVAAAEHGHSHPGADPHCWLCPASLITMSKTVADAFCELDPGRVELYRQNQRALQSELESLDEEIKRILKTYTGRRFYIYHPSWGYFSDAYGLEQAAIELQGNEPSDKELTRIQKRMREDGARVIFVQPQIAGKSVAAVARAVGVRVETLDPLAKDVIQNLRRAARIIAESFDQ